MIRSPMIWPVSWPLPAMSKISPARNSAIARRIASRRSPISVAPGAAAMIAARIAAGASPRGMSAVTITPAALAAGIVVGDDHPVGFGGGDGAHQGSLATIAIATRAEHDDESTGHVGTQA